MSLNELSAANEVLTDAAACLRRQLDIANLLLGAAKEAVLEVNNAAGQHLDQLHQVSQDLVEESKTTEVPAFLVPSCRPSFVPWFPRELLLSDGVLDVPCHLIWSPAHVHSCGNRIDRWCRTSCMNSARKTKSCSRFYCPSCRLECAFP